MFRSNFKIGKQEKKLRKIIGLHSQIGNELCYIETVNKLTYETLPPSEINPGDIPHLVEINEFGLAFSHDCDGNYFDDDEDYFRTTFIPWSQVITIVAKIWT